MALLGTLVITNFIVGKLSHC